MKKLHKIQLLLVCIVGLFAGTGCAPSLKDIKTTMTGVVKPIDDRLKKVEKDVSQLKKDGSTRDTILARLEKRTRDFQKQAQQTYKKEKAAGICAGGEWSWKPVEYNENGQIKVRYVKRCVKNTVVRSDDPRLHSRRYTRRRSTRRSTRRSRRRGVSTGRGRVKSGGWCTVDVDDKTKVGDTVDAHLPTGCKFYTKRTGTIGSGSGSQDYAIGYVQCVNGTKSKAYAKYLEFRRKAGCK